MFVHPKVRSQVRCKLRPSCSAKLWDLTRPMALGQKVECSPEYRRHLAELCRDPRGVDNPVAVSPESVISTIDRPGFSTRWALSVRCPALPLTRNRSFRELDSMDRAVEPLASLMAPGTTEDTFD